jgi:hypothetical protein
LVLKAELLVRGGGAKWFMLERSGVKLGSNSAHVRNVASVVDSSRVRPIAQTMFELGIVTVLLNFPELNLKRRQ